MINKQGNSPEFISHVESGTIGFYSKKKPKCQDDQ